MSREAIYRALVTGQTVDASRAAQDMGPQKLKNFPKFLTGQFLSDIWAKKFDRVRSVQERINEIEPLLTAETFSFLKMYFSLYREVADATEAHLKDRGLRCSKGSLKGIRDLRFLVPLQEKFELLRGGDDSQRAAVSLMAGKLASIRGRGRASGHFSNAVRLSKGLITDLYFDMGAVTYVSEKTANRAPALEQFFHEFISPPRKRRRAHHHLLG